MLMSFTTTRLMNHRVRVAGTDTFGVTDQIVLNSAEWDEIKADSKYDQATEAFDAAVKEFFAPLLAAADEAVAAIATPDDPMSFVVLKDAVEAQAGQEQVLVHLSQDSIVLRLIEEGQTDRLVWVQGSLEVLEAGATDLPGAVSDDS